MVRISPLRNRAGGAVMLGMLAAAAAIVVFAASGGEPGAALARRSAGHPQLVSVQRFPVTGGEECPWTPASAGSSLLAARQQERTDREAVPSEVVRAEAAKRSPVRVLHDPYPAYSAVAVDPMRNEVVMTDENLFSIMVYDRQENTPPKAKMSEPKRMIRGRRTKIELECSLYIDPANGDIYGVSNDTLDKVLVFSRRAQGDIAPDRIIETPHTTFGIAVDEKNQEMLLTVQDDAAVVTFRKSAPQSDSPLRNLQGQRTLLADPHGITIDAKKDQIFVSNWGSVNVHTAPDSGPRVGSFGRGAGKANWPVGRNYAVPGSGKFLPPSITVYPRTARGDTAPLRIIQGPQTQLNWPTALALDSEHGELYVANDPTHSILVFRSDANGDVAPVRVLRGPQTLLRNPTGVYVDLKNDELWAANFGSHSATVYKRSASGDTPPLRVIRSGPAEAPAPMFGNPAGLTFDTKRDEILVSN